MPNPRELAQIGEGPRVFQAAYKQPLRHSGKELLDCLIVPLIDRLVVRFVVCNRKESRTRETDGPPVGRPWMKLSSHHPIRRYTAAIKTAHDEFLEKLWLYRHSRRKRQSDTCAATRNLPNFPDVADHPTSYLVAIEILLIVFEGFHLSHITAMDTRETSSK